MTNIMLERSESVDHAFTNHGPPGNMELYSQREAVNGKFVKTKKVNKLSNYYMDILLR